MNLTHKACLTLPDAPHRNPVASVGAGVRARRKSPAAPAIFRIQRALKLS
jgi:hypothetical protein